jgi:hypothetical protein
LGLQFTSNGQKSIPSKSLAPLLHHLNPRQLVIMAFKKQLNTEFDPMTIKKTAVVSISPLESRGSRMLKAALNNKTPLKDRAPTANDERSNVVTVKQVIKNRKRSPKNNVLFREPVVSQEFNYEQIYFDDITDESQNEQHNEKVHEEVPQRDSDLQQAAKNNDECLTNQAHELGEPDEDGDLFTMASSDVPALSEAELKRQANGATKRPHRSIENDEQEDAKHKSGNELGGGGLFSSPKVAKIAPYFDERPHDNRPREIRAANKNRLRSLQQRSLCTKRYTIKRNDSVLSQSRGPLYAVPQDDKADLTLSSYKKFSSPQVCKRPEPQTFPPADETNCKSEANGYFGWIASFITNQMNKLIF